MTNNSVFYLFLNASYYESVWEVFILQCHVRNEQLVYAITFTVFHNWPKAYIIINDQHQTIYLRKEL